VSIRAQTYKNIELVVVDNFSTDTTAAIAKKYTEKFFEKGPERSAQRNYGAAQATGEYVVFIDSDMELTETVIASCVEKMASDKSFAGVIIPEESFGEGFWAQCKRLEKRFYVGLDSVEAARFFRKSEFEEVGGYNTQLHAGEDWDLSDRIEQRGHLARVSALIRHNEGRINLFRTLTKKFYYAGAAVAYLKSTAGDATASKRRTGGFGRIFISLKRPALLFANPLVGLGMLFMKVAEFGAGFTGMIVRQK
jgi:glycosyltransferase involved in cell wall biosynthesis